jgi:hypothetical protein
MHETLIYIYIYIIQLVVTVVNIISNILVIVLRS